MGQAGVSSRRLLQKNFHTWNIKKLNEYEEQQGLI